MNVLAPLILAAAVINGQAGPQDNGEVEFRDARTVVRPRASAVLYKTQRQGALDHETAGQVKLPGIVIPAGTDDRGRLQLTVGKRNYKLSGPRSIHVKLPKDKSGGQFTVVLLFRLTDDKKWVYRNVTELQVMVGNETLTVVDVNCNGLYNEPGIDGMAWDKQEFLFPLPGPQERWCTRKLELTGLEFGPQGQDLKMKTRPLATKAAGTLALLEGINDERVAVGVTPRPENPRLSEELQRHCHYMKLNNVLTHPEDAAKPGYSAEGNAAGRRSILSMGRAPAGIAKMMVNTLFHRYDVIRHNTRAFGLGYEGRYGGIDGRSDLFEAPVEWWPLRCPAPDQHNVRLRFEQEQPPPIKQSTAGFPISMYFNTRNLKLKAHSLRQLGGPSVPGTPGPVPWEVECFVLDPQTGDNHSHMGYQKAVALIPKSPLTGGMLYQVSMTVDVDGRETEYTWRFKTR